MISLSARLIHPNVCGFAKSMLHNVLKDIDIEQHFGMKRFFIKFMINTLCNMFPSNFRRNPLVCGSYMRALEKKNFDLRLGDSFLLCICPFIIPWTSKISCAYTLMIFFNNTCTLRKILYRGYKSTLNLMISEIMNIFWKNPL